MPESRSEHRWFLAGLVALVGVVALDVGAGEAVDAPIAVTVGPLVAALGAKRSGVVALALAAAVAGFLLSVLAGGLGSSGTYVRTGAVVALAGIAVMATIQRDRRSTELRRSRPALLLQDLSRALASCRTPAEVVAVFDRWSNEILPSGDVELWLGPDLTTRGLGSAPVSIPLSGPSGGIGVLRAGGTLDDGAAEDLLSQAAGLVSLALDRSGYIEELATTATRLQALQEATLELAGAEGVNDVAVVAVDVGRKALAADLAMIYERREDVAHLLAAAGLDLDRRVACQDLPLAASASVRDDLAAGASVQLHSGADLQTRYGYLVSSGDHIDEALLAAPVEIEGDVAAVLYVGFGYPRTFSRDDLRLVESLTTLISYALRRARQREAEELRARRARNRAKRAELLDRFTVALADADDPTAVSEQFIDGVIPATSASWGAIFALDRPSETLRLLATKELYEGYAPAEISLAERMALTDAVHEGRPVLLGDVDEILDAYPSTRLSGGEVAWAAVPMNIGTDVVGVMGLGFAEPQQFDHEYESFLVAASERLSHALERARERERRRREERRWALLAQASELLASAPVPDEVLGRFVRWSVPEIADAIAVYVTRDDGKVAVANYVDDPEADAVAADLDRFPIDLQGDHPLGGVLRGEQIIIADPIPSDLVGLIARDPLHARIVAGLKLERAVVVPLVSSGTPFGVLAVAMGRSDRPFDDDHLRLINDLASRLALALDNAYRLDAERRAGLTVQTALLPGTVPDVAGLEFAVRYEAAGSHAGGDWYDVIPLGKDTVGVAVGDVVGHGIAASAEMARYRSALRSYALTHADPDEVMALLRRFARADEFETMATILYGVIDVPRSTFTYASAGHPPPLRVTGGRAKVLEVGQGPPVGVAAEHTGSSTVQLDPGDLIVLYTDGLVERRGEIIDVGIERLAAAAACTSSLPTSALCDRLISALVDDRPRDDIAIVAIRVKARE